MPASLAHVRILDGPTGTELARRGVATGSAAWSARAIREAPDVLGSIHADYARAGATIHTAATFRARFETLGAGWRGTVGRAIAIARDAVPDDHTVLGSLAPLADCYTPWNTPNDPGPAHRVMARALARAGADGILVETFAHPDEARIATAEAADTGLSTWTSLTPGWRGDLLSPEALADAAAACLDAGADRVFVNCAPAAEAHRWVAALARLEAPFGVYANAGPQGGDLGWGAGGAERYAALALHWCAQGATVVGGCCGTDPAHVRAIATGIEGGHGDRAASRV